MFEPRRVAPGLYVSWMSVRLVRLYPHRHTRARREPLIVGLEA